MTQINGLRPQDWAAYQDGGNQWMLLEEAQAVQGSTAAGNAGAYSGGYGAAVNAASGYGTWMQAPAPPPLTYVTFGYTEYGDPICVPVEAPQARAAAAPAPAPIRYATVGYTEYGDPICAPADDWPAMMARAAAASTPATIAYTTVGYTEYGDPICAPLAQAPAPTVAPAPLSMSPISYDQGHALAHETAYAAPVPVAAPVPAPVPVYQSYDQGYGHVYTPIYEASPAPAPVSAPVATPAPAPAAAWLSQEMINAVSAPASSPAPATASASVSAPAPAPAPAVDLSISAATHGESGELVSGDSRSAAHGTRRRAQNFEGGFGGFDSFGTYDYGATDFGIGGFDAGGQDDWASVDSGFDWDNGFHDDSLYGDSFDNDPFDNDPFDNDAFDWQQSNTSTEVYGPFVPVDFDATLVGVGGNGTAVDLGAGSLGSGSSGTEGGIGGATGAVTSNTAATDAGTDGDTTNTVVVVGSRAADMTAEIPEVLRSIFNTLSIVPQAPNQFIGPPSPEQQWWLGATGLLLAHSDVLQLADYAAGIASIFDGDASSLDGPQSLTASLGRLSSVGVGAEAAPGELDQALRWLQRLTGALPTAAEVVETASLLARVGVRLLPLVIPGNIGQGQSVIQAMNATQRLVSVHGELYGDLQELGADGNWQTIKSGARLYEVNGEKKAWTDAEAASGLAQLKASVDTSSGGTTPGYPATEGQVNGGTPGYGTTDIRPSGTTTTPNGNGQITGGAPPYGTTEVGPPWPTTTESPIPDQIRIDDLIVTSRGLTPGSAEHKDAAWELYQGRGGEWGFDHWSGVYDANQTRAAQANAAVDAYWGKISWGQREQTVKLTIDSQEETRRLDIADRSLSRGIEYKTGYQYLGADNAWELQRDAKLVQEGWDIEWVFRDAASQPLLDALNAAGIRYKIGD